MAKITLSEAAELLNNRVSLATLHRHTKAGTLSCTTNPQGHKVVDVAELERVYGPLENPHENGNGSHENVKQEDMRKVENPEIVEVLREQIAMLKSQLETANNEKQQVLRILENQTLMLPAPEKKRHGWWGYFRFRK